MRVFISFLLIFYTNCGFTQDEFPELGDDQKLEEQADWLEDAYQKLDQIKSHPINLNETNEDELSNFPFLSTLQIVHLLNYRKLLGPLVELLELQAVPGWDVETIKRIMPYVVVKQPGTKWDLLKKELQKNDQMILYRTNFNDLLNFGKSRNSSTALLRYRFASNIFQGGLQIEKDKGEKWWTEKKGISFISGYVTVKTGTFIKEILVGDYQIGMGQGLVMGMGRGVIKSTATMLIKRQTVQMMPFRSTDENRFMRGIAMVLGKNKLQGMLFGSSNRIDANIIEDTLNQTFYISSLQSSGLHVTESEIQDWDAVTIYSLGCRLVKKIPRGDISLNQVLHHFESPIHKEELPYNNFALRGNKFGNFSLDFGKTIYNTHFFGEFAVDQKKHQAFLIGALVSLHRNLDFSFLFRNYGVGYHSYLSKSLSENSEPSNERGVYVGLTMKLHPSMQLESYVDMFSFPWLKYRLDRPSNGIDHMLQLTWKPDKKTFFTVRFKNETKYINSDVNHPLHWVGALQKNGLRTQMEHRPGLNWKWRARFEYLKVKKEWGDDERGMLFFLDFFWSKQDFSINGRMMYCSTDGFDSRIYAYENDVLYYGHISQFQGRLIRTYLNLDFKLFKNVHFYTKISRSLIRTEIVMKF